MEKTAKRRRHEATKPTSTTKPRKRQKLGSNSAPARRRVRPDDLQWRSVEMPDRLDDYEGFFGLEEIEGVDVVKDESTGAISFQTSKLGIERKQGDSNDEVIQGFGQGGSDNGSWEGFSDEEEVKSRQAKSEETQTTSDEPSAISTRTEQDNGKKPKTQKRILEAETALAAKKSPKQKYPNDMNGESAFDLLANRPMDDDVGEVDVSAWHELGLSEDTLGSLSRLKFSQPTPIQTSAIPEILAGHDVIGKASTGSGKTLAFGIPILESFLSRKPSKTKTPIALVISPTRELAHQITAHLSALCSGGDFETPLIATITGGLSVQKQRRQLEKADIIIGTPGRLWEVISTGHGLLKSLKQIQFLVVDEADRLLSQGHYEEFGEILNLFERNTEEEGDGSSSETASSPQRQTLVFSATFHKGLQQKLAGKTNKGGDLMSKQESMEYLLKKLRFREEKPKFIDANPTSQMASGLKEGLIECAGTEKDLYLYALLLFHPKKRALVFTNSIDAVRRITPFLQNLNLPALPLHGDMIQKARLRSVEHFTERSGSILVATDVAARGLDIPGVELIVHYSLSRAADTYVHRSGRTARAQASGSSIIICAPEEVAGVRRLVAKVHAQAKSKRSAGFIRTLDIDRRIVSRLKPRATLAKKLADTVNAKEKKHSQDDLFREAAEDLGVDYDSDALEAEARGKRGRGAGRKKKEKEARTITKAELHAMRAELRELLSQKINTGVSARYLTSGGVDVDALLKGDGNAEFLGHVDSLGFDDEP